MENLTNQNKFNILQTFIMLTEKDHPEFNQENTTGWDLMENAKVWLEELRLNKDAVVETEKEKV